MSSRPLIEQMAVAYATEIEELRAEIERWKAAAGEWETKAYNRAEEIERLEELVKLEQNSQYAENAQLRAALEEIAKYDGFYLAAHNAYDFAKAARAALANEQET